MATIRLTTGILLALFLVVTPGGITASSWLEEQVRQELREEEQMRALWKLMPPPEALPPGLQKPVHIIFTFVDHWEPGTGPGAAAKAEIWYNDYAQMARRHSDADGRYPQQDWFCEFLEKVPLQIIAKTVFDELGEMNVHIHHGTENDNDRDNTAEMTALIDEYVSYLNNVGACLTATISPQMAFAFIHGMWALDNSRYLGGFYQYCGVNREIDLLLSKNCYADFTFPAWGPMQPTLMMAKIFASRDCPEPKSYDMETNIHELHVGDPPTMNELVIFEGPWNSTNIDMNETPTLSRMHDWVNYYVHIPGIDNWVFVKVYTHGAQSLSNPRGYKNLVGENADRFYSDIEASYNDGVNYKLHYCTAREAYNIAVAIADGAVNSSDPNDYRDYKIPPPVNKFYFCDAFYRVLRRDTADSETEIQIVENSLPSSLTIWTKDFLFGSTSVLEKNAIGDPYKFSDADTSTVASIPLVVHDRTCSKYYLLRKRSISRCPNWIQY